MSQTILHCSSLHCLKLNLKSAYLHGKLHMSKKCRTSSKNTRKCIASRNLTKRAFLQYIQTQFISAYRQILHTSSVHNSRVYCTCFKKAPVDSGCFKIQCFYNGLDDFGVGRNDPRTEEMNYLNRRKHLLVSLFPPKKKKPPDATVK